MCAWKRPRERAAHAAPVATCGLWGSPSLSEKAWCLRWSATHAVTGPSIAIEPMIARPPWTQGLALNARCVRWRWKPTVTPRPVIRYMIRKTATSLQWRRSFQTCQPTIPSAMNGRTVMVPVAMRSRVSFATGWTSSMPGGAAGAIGVAWAWLIEARSSRLGGLPCPVDRDRVGADPEANERGGRASMCRGLAAAHLPRVVHRGRRAVAQRDRRGPAARTARVERLDPVEGGEAELVVHVQGGRA